ESDTLIDLMPALKAHVKSDGSMVISGVPTISQSRFLDMLEGSSLRVLSTAIEGEWAGYLVTHAHRRTVR
ncbi:MAG: hypothetical protein ACE5G5_11555, partial [Candidatus Methylomirabilales bacterium]